ncbi:cytochrome P450 [Xylariaceae sp. FL0662B]|nr:cytochrome P450 [Xylariaceae sp. FL0662B]
MSKTVHDFFTALREQHDALQKATKPVQPSKMGLPWLSLGKARHDITLALWTLSPRARYTVLAGIIILVAIVVDQITAKRSSLRKLGLPLVTSPKGVKKFDYKSILDEGKRKYPGLPYLISYSGFELVVFPNASWDEIKRVPVTKASTLEYFTCTFFQGWRFLGSDTSAVHKSIGIDLTRSLPTRIWAHQDSAARACERALGLSSDWKSFRMYWTLQDLISTTNAAGLVGPALGTNPRWTTAIQSFVLAIVFAIATSSLPPRFLRPLVTLFVFLPAWGLYWYMRWLLLPMVREDMNEYVTAAQDNGKNEIIQAEPHKKFPFTAWLLNRYPPDERKAANIGHDYVVASFESTSATSATFYFIMAELVQRPGVVEELREELSRVMVDGRLPQTQLSELEKMDSFMRECSRWNPFGHMALFRRLCAPVKLSVGPELPAGTLIAVDVHEVPRSEELWETPEEFDPWRFLKLRQLPGRQNRHQFTSLGRDTPGWGDGPQACPGRAFASTTLKVTLAHLLIHYDFRLPPGSRKPKRGSMPNGSMRPDMFVKMQFRARQ